jgi:hypothetical protein
MPSPEQNVRLSSHPNGIPVVTYTEIARLATPSGAAAEKFILRHLRARCPVIFGGAHAFQERTRSWSLPFLREELGHLDVIVAKTDARQLRASPTAGQLYGRMRLGDIIAAMEAGEDPGWVVVHPVNDLPHAFASILSPPPYCRGAKFLRSKLWLAVTGATTPMHWDLPHNFVAPLFGRRRAILFPRHYGLALRPNAPYSRTPNYARFDAEYPDYRRYPFARFARPLGAVIEPGDLLFIPSGWWHQVRTLETSLNVNFWWGGRGIDTVVRVGNAFKRWRGIYQGEWS